MRTDQTARFSTIVRRAMLLAMLVGAQAAAAGGGGPAPVPARPNSFSYPPWGEFGCMDDNECQNTSVCIPQPDGGFPGTCYVRKNRYLTIDPNPANTGVLTARRVSKVTVTGPEMLGWISEPDAEHLSRVVATAFFADWSTLGTVELADCEIQPQQTYHIESTADGAAFSNPLVLPTSGAWGDVAGSVVGGVISPPQGIPNLADALIVGDAILGDNDLPVSWVDLRPDIPDHLPTIEDSIAIVEAFQGGAFVIDACPAIQPECGNNIMEPDEQCDDGNTDNGDGCDRFCQDESTSAAVMALIPVDASGPHAINGDTITVTPGQRIRLELFVSQWGPGVAVNSYQAFIDCETVNGGSAAMIHPIAERCTVFHGLFCHGIDDERSDQIFPFALGFPDGCNVSNECPGGEQGRFMCGRTTFSTGVANDGSAKYAATYAVEVDENALGTFEVTLDADPVRTLLRDQNFDRIAPIRIIPAQIEVVGAMAAAPLSFSYPPWGEFGCDTVVKTDTCTTDDECPSFACDAFCNADGFCEEPPDCACQNLSVCVPQPDGSFPGTCYVPKNRALSVAPNPANAGTGTTRRVSVLSSSTGPGCDGTRCVLGFFDTPSLAFFGQSFGDIPSVFVSRLTQTAPDPPIDWSTLGDLVAFPEGAPVHLMDCVVQPTRVYEIQSSSDGVIFGSALTLPAGFNFADATGGIVSGVVSPPQGVANLVDASRMIKGAQDLNTEPYIWLELANANNPNLIINLVDASLAVKAFEGQVFSDQNGWVSPCSCSTAGAGAPCPP